MRHNLNLNWLRSFEATARLLSFTAASHEIGLTQSAVSQHIKALEAQLDDKLFVRRPKSLQLTDVGKAYLLTVREALETIEMSTTGLFGPRRASTITVRTSMAFIMWITPKLDSFLLEHLDIGVKLVTSIWKIPTDQQPVDVEVILAPNEHARPELELLSGESIVPVCSPALSSDIKTPQDLLRRSPIHIMGFDDHWARYLSAHALKPASSGGRLITDTSTAAIGMVAAGLGCAVVIEKFAQQAIETGQGICIVGKPIALGQSHYLVRPQRRTIVQPAVEAFEAWLREQF
ncbi:LysR family transcriptional regulator [Pseudohalocynthiibacter sp. F2068]|jgi:DNA-binding transcriptional LysR family regulator|uniref:LysR family transcriptional regulator n=1 Tax=Pseudohalocynthiibacter sp. F2068 TaxID=2926418 RepID=UPI001FF41A3D|nr:LysR family transcriptional regulator [Pseudohalocynthiibacter sp. F2068]MCK0101866.1 LysR family transcriptional regulator [Pseudohalocynthiibacter sp. F2068]